MLSVNSPWFLFQSSTSKKGENGPDRDRGSIGHLAGHWISEYQLRMRTQAALPKTQDEIARTLEQFTQKSAGGGPAKCHNAPGDSRDDQGSQQLRRPNPGANRGTEFHIAHAHAAHPTENAEKQPTQRYAFKAVPDAGPAVERGGDDDPCKQERKNQPIGNAAAAQVSQGRNGDDNERWPQSYRVHAGSFRFLGEVRWCKSNSPSKA